MWLFFMPKYRYFLSRTLLFLRMHRILLLAGCFLLFLGATAQYPPYPKGYFINPLSIPMELTANFGELRSDHWHMGLDIRTNTREDLPVRAAANGYIAAIGIRPLGFGRYIEIRHPNGLSTLYAHLNDFMPSLEEFVTRKQYEQESWAIDLRFTPDQFPIRQGQLIAYSGNTGGSAGPHLHFEIFDTKSSQRLNPLLFGFSLSDQVPPVIKNLALYDRGRSMNDQSPQIFSLRKTALGYELVGGRTIKTTHPRLSFAIEAIDQVSGSPNPNGIYSAELFFDDKKISGFRLDSIDYEETGYINAHIDYAHKKRVGRYFQHLSPLCEEASGVYQLFSGDGLISLADTAAHTVVIKVADTNGNESVVCFSVQFDPLFTPSALPPKKEDSPFAFIKPNEAFSFKRPTLELSLPAGAVYDSLPFFYQTELGVLPPGALTPRYRVNQTAWTLHKEGQLKLKLAKLLPDSLQQKLVLQYSGESTTRSKAATYQQGWVMASFGSFGSFQAYLDTIAPVVQLKGKGDTIDLSAQRALVFTPTDNFGSIKSFRAELNGQWLRFTNDKAKTWVYRFDERCPYGTHQLTVTVEDGVGNRTTRSWYIKRGPYQPPVKKKKYTSKRKR